MDFYTTAIMQALAFTMLGLGIFISMKVFNIPDITTDGSYTLGGAVTAVMLINGYSPYAAFLVAVLCGATAGMITGVIHTKLKVNALLAGILVMTGLYSVNLTIMGQPNIPLLAFENLFSIISLSGSVLTNKLLLLTGFALIFSMLLIYILKTDFGIAMRCTGNNETMARANGVNTLRMKITGLAMANAFTALSGYLMVQYQGFADINMGIGIVISGLAAVMIGETLMLVFKLRSILWQIIFVIAGTIAFRLILAFALSLGLNPNYLKLATALIVLAVLAAALVRKPKAA